MWIFYFIKILSLIAIVFLLWIIKKFNSKSIFITEECNLSTIKKLKSLLGQTVIKILGEYSTFLSNFYIDFNLSNDLVFI